MMIRQMLEECQKGTDGVGFNEVVLMVSNTASSAEVYMTLDDVRFTEKGDVVTFMVQDGTHLHLNLEQVKEVQFIHKMNEQNLPSYSVWFKDENHEPVLRIYLRKSDNEGTNQPRHNLFMGLMEKYGETVKVAG
ncbi:MAG TPA: ChuX/HutX family heme-like substrate-binding protein [Dehalococcoidia bacterium]|nr:ChuX/HutX family heme-like substrate-binding protein [Dehalococcoidia bacterium]